MVKLRTVPVILGHALPLHVANPCRNANPASLYNLCTADQFRIRWLAPLFILGLRNENGTAEFIEAEKENVMTKIPPKTHSSGGNALGEQAYSVDPKASPGKDPAVNSKLETAGPKRVQKQPGQGTQDPNGDQSQDISGREGD
ncbi:MAG: hypothetical protein H7245_22885 [Candidatus Saccharibacteria bacterium]|nr:hypothetical protein [Pseudorhodobacter sp.]